jgi:hypothetical protein
VHLLRAQQLRPESRRWPTSLLEGCLHLTRSRKSTEQNWPRRRRRRKNRHQVSSKLLPPLPNIPISASPVTTPTAPHASNASPLSNVNALDSLKTSAEAVEEDGKSKGKLSSLIYGTKEGREMEKEIEQSFSQVLARGKYVHSIVFHQVKPEKVDEYVELVGSWYPKMASMPENKVHLVGSWRTEVGDCDTFGKSKRHLFMDRRPGINKITHSSYLGVPKIPRLSRFSSLHL